MARVAKNQGGSKASEGKRKGRNTAARSRAPGRKKSPVPSHTIKAVKLSLPLKKPPLEIHGWQSNEFSLTNLKAAYCKSLALAGIGAANASCDRLLPHVVRSIVPRPDHQGFPARLLACVTQVCTNPPFQWRVVQDKPLIRDDTTFQNLLIGWFQDVVWEK